MTSIKITLQAVPDAQNQVVLRNIDPDFASQSRTIRVSSNSVLAKYLGVELPARGSYWEKSTPEGRTVTLDKAQQTKLETLLRSVRELDGQPNHVSRFESSAARMLKNIGSAVIVVQWDSAVESEAREKTDFRYQARQSIRGAQIFTDYQLNAPGQQFNNAVKRQLAAQISESEFPIVQIDPYQTLDPQETLRALGSAVRDCERGAYCAPEIKDYAELDRITAENAKISELRATLNSAVQDIGMTVPQFEQVLSEVGRLPDKSIRPLAYYGRAADLAVAMKDSNKMARWAQNPDYMREVLRMMVYSRVKLEVALGAAHYLLDSQHFPRPRSSEAHPGSAGFAALYKDVLDHVDRPAEDVPAAVEQAKRSVLLLEYEHESSRRGGSSTTSATCTHVVETAQGRVAVLLVSEHVILHKNTGRFRVSATANEHFILDDPQSITMSDKNHASVATDVYAIAVPVNELPYEPTPLPFASRAKKQGELYIIARDKVVTKAHPPRPIKVINKTHYHKQSSQPLRNQDYFVSVSASRPGDSGGLILNAPGEIVGFIHAGDLKFNLYGVQFTAKSRKKLERFVSSHK